jgi:hypothetical protein
MPLHHEAAEKRPRPVGQPTKVELAIKVVVPCGCRSGSRLGLLAEPRKDGGESGRDDPSGHRPIPKDIHLTAQLPPHPKTSLRQVALGKLEIE